MTAFVRESLAHALGTLMVITLVVAVRYVFQRRWPQTALLILWNYRRWIARAMVSAAAGAMIAEAVALIANPPPPEQAAHRIIASCRDDSGATMSVTFDDESDLNMAIMQHEFRVCLWRSDGQPNESTYYASPSDPKVNASDVYGFHIGSNGPPVDASNWNPFDRKPALSGADPIAELVGL